MNWIYRAMVPRILVLLVIACFIVVPNRSTAQTTTNNRPNILLILTDDQGYGDVAYAGNTNIETPNLDAFAADCVRLDGFHAAPVCSPTRAALMTGRQFLRTGVWGVHGGRDYLNLREVTIADRLRDAGYATAMFGKWHLGHGPAWHPTRRGFDVGYALTDHTLYAHEDPVFQVGFGVENLSMTGWTTDLLTDLTLERIDAVESETPDQPWLIYLAYPAIHEPWVAPQTLVDQYLARGQSLSLATVSAMTEQLDAAVGRLLAGLNERGLDDHTIVLFMGDNGPIGNATNLPHLTDAEMLTRNPLGLRGVKGNVWENGSRAPGLIRFGDHLSHGIRTETVDIIDIAPTLLAVAGVEPTEEAPAMDGVNLLPLLTQGTQPELDERMVIYGNHDTVWPTRSRLYDPFPGKAALIFEAQPLAARRGPFKYVQAFGNADLYHLPSDPTESHDASAEYPGERAALVADLTTWYAALLADEATLAMPVFPIGDPATMPCPIRASATNQIAPADPNAEPATLFKTSHAIQRWQHAADFATWRIHVIEDCTVTVRLDAELGSEMGSEMGSELDADGVNGPIDPGSLALVIGQRMIPMSRNSAAPDAQWTASGIRLYTEDTTIGLAVTTARSDGAPIIQQLWRLRVSLD